MAGMSVGGSTIRFEPGETLIARVDLPGLRLRVTTGADAGLRRSLALAVVRIGSAPENDVVLTAPGVSRHHAELHLEDGRLRLLDLDSTNGTWIGATRVKEAWLSPGVSFRIGEDELVAEPEGETRTSRLASSEAPGGLVARSAAMREVVAVVKAVAPTHATVLLTGESGSGKEVVARAIHDLSGRAGRFEVFDAASTDPEMVRSDLFGHKRGAFTGAAEAREGAFRMAHGGTLFLDEIGELPLELQSRLLRVLETREVQPLGSDERHRIDVRLVAATHRDLEGMVAKGSFRADLYHRLAVVPLRLPPLRERREDLPGLVAGLAATLGVELRLTPEAERALAGHGWPGNVRELRNALERAHALAAGGPVEVRHLGLGAASAPSPNAIGDLASLEKRAILDALERQGGNRTRAAKALGISVATLHRRIKEYGLGE